MKNTYLAFLAILLSPMAANADFISFQYTFGDGTVLAGSLDGTVQGDADTITINSFGTVTLGGVAMNSIEATDICSISDFPSCSLQALISFSGATMDVFVCSLGFSGGNCGFVTDGGFFLDSTGTFGAAAAVPGSSFIRDREFDARRWIARRSDVVAVSEPGTLALLGLGLIGLGLARRRRNA